MYVPTRQRPVPIAGFSELGRRPRLFGPKPNYSVLSASPSKARRKPGDVGSEPTSMEAEHGQSERPEEAAGEERSGRRGADRRGAQGGGAEGRAAGRERGRRSPGDRSPVRHA